MNGLQSSDGFLRVSGVSYRGKDARYRTPPAQIPAGAIRAPGSGATEQ